MKLLISLGEISQKTKNTFKRFPITLIWAIIGTLFCLYVSEIEANEVFYGRVILTFILGVSWLIATRFLEEQFSNNKQWIFLITLVFLFFFYWHLPSDEARLESIYITRFILFFIAGHLLVLVAPFFFKWTKETYFNYLKTVFVAITRSLLFSLILYLGFVLALLAIKHLFSVDFDGKRFLQIFIVCIGIVNTWTYLADFPKDIHHQNKIDYGKALEVLVKYILIPLVILYLIILYAYALKITINWNLPKGWVSYLVIALSLLGFFIQILINPIQKSINSRPINKFYPWFYYALLPLIVLLFIAIFRRISEYGVTENRYFVLVLALWILAISLYMLFSKQKRMMILPLSLSILALLVSFGFWGAFSVSTNSQLQQFQKVYSEIETNGFTTTLKKKNQLRSIVYYLSDKQQLHKVETVLGYSPTTTFKTDNKWQLQNRLLDSLNIKITDTKSNTRSYFTLDQQDFVITTKGYDALKQIYLNNYHRDDQKIASYKFALQKASNRITIWKNNDSIGVLDCSLLLQTLRNKENTHNINQKLMTLEKEFEQVKFKFIFQDISLYNETEKKNTLSSANVYVLLKEKEDAE
ncbi:hypothetical protein WH52_13175 [Tenacibaculum holothuriorum]|uniref:DUF4153 domain-containing protein n=1 Tax=Tenacibaculum holothuriorum TaxID=1635173 RepID=A0A1Y2P992_9FLAO|nr:DUF4153 domain-containing protein [Tenacibaculum holothuriorum]OSY87012.1 hypothetical protein WH52_13175 [Tenacibaculum holothuriorum]